MTIPETHKVALVAKKSESADAIEYAEVPAPQITSPTDVIIKNKYSGVNYIDTYFRQGLYPAQFPLTFGKEGAGVVAAVGDKVTQFKVGDRVAYIGSETHAQYVKIDESHVQICKLGAGDDNDLKTWAAGLLQGLTTLTFASEAYAVKKGDYVLVWAAAGGMGRLLTRYVTSLGGHVIAVASTDAKLAVAKDLGAEHLVKSSDDVVQRVQEITGGAGVAVSFDGVGKDSFDSSLAAVSRKGTIVSFGNASGAVPPLSIGRLTPKCVKLVRPMVYGYVQTRDEWEHYVSLLDKSLKNGSLVLDIYKTYPLADFKQASRDLEGRKTTGKLLLEIPQ